MHSQLKRDQQARIRASRFLTALWLGLILLLVNGCCGPSALEQDYGKSWAYNQAIQVADPQAGLEQTPATGLPPKAAANVMETYDKGFSGQAGQAQSTTINLSPMTTGSGGK